jgi:4-cresol dehydrogenase (hydroxylating) flavoprotein subunit
VNADGFFREIAQETDAQVADRTEDTCHRYGETTLPGGDRRPAGVLFPRSSTDVRAIVRAANRHGVPLWPISTGNNIGLGSRAPVTTGQVVVDLGRRMNRILEVNDELGYAVVEPGVTFQALADELARRGDKLMVSATSGPPLGGVLGNALDKGGGYGPYFDHFGMLCGMEIVLGTGDTIRTGDGSLASEQLLNWHVSKYSFGPVLDGLFAQANYGIVTRAAVWLMPRPPAVQSFHFAFPDDDDFAAIVDLCRPLKLSNFVPTLFRISNDIYVIGTEETNPEYAQTSGKQAISAAARRALHKKHGLGAWVVSGAFYGPSAQAMAPQIERVKAHFGQSKKAVFISHDEALKMPALKIAVDSMSGRPGQGELGLLNWRPGGGNSWFLPGTPMQGRMAGELDRLARGVYDEHGMDFMVMHVAGARFARGLHVLVWNRADEDENRRADACYRKLVAEFARRGVSVGRAPTEYQELHMSMLMPEFREACSAIKRALDPNGIIAPGKYGIR